MSTKIEGTVNFPDTVNVIGDFNPPSDFVLPATQQQKARLIEYGKPGTAASETVPLYVCRGATATIVGIHAGSVAIAIGAATVTIDLKKNGASILTGVITLDSANTARIMEDGVLSNAALVEDDFLELVIVATAGGGTIPTGLLVQVEINEDQP